MINPKVTVLMPVYNGEKYIKEALESILSQTYSDFELLIINDGSVDNSAMIVESFSDSRIRLVNNEVNLKLGKTRNKGLELSQGEYIAFMDCDDIALPERLEKQVKFMDENPEIGVCGSWIEFFGEKTGTFEYPAKPDEVKSKLFFFSAIPNVSAIIRKRLFEKFNLKYDENLLYFAEDYDLWQRCSRHFPMANIPEVLQKYRITDNSTSRISLEKQMNILMELDKRNLKELELEFDEETLKLHQEICPLRHPAMPVSKEFVIKAENWLKKIYLANLKIQIYPEPIFSRLIGERWLTVCSVNSQKFGNWILKTYYDSELSLLLELSLKQKADFARKCG